jgi:hypothetical protein
VSAVKKHSISFGTTNLLFEDLLSCFPQCFATRSTVSSMLYVALKIISTKKKRGRRRRRSLKGSVELIKSNRGSRSSIFDSFPGCRKNLESSHSLLTIMSSSQSGSTMAISNGNKSAEYGYTLAIIGCGTMGIAILSGMLDSRKANEAKKAASAVLSSSQPQSNIESNGNGSSNDLSASIASLLDLDEDGDSSSSKQVQLPSQFIACVSRSESAKKLRKTFGEYSNQIEVVSSDNLRAVQKADVVLLACKPQVVKEVLGEQGIKEALRGKLVCSICAGLTIKSIRLCLNDDTTVVRAMPNTPSKVSLYSISRLNEC